MYVPVKERSFMRWKSSAHKNYETNIQINKNVKSSQHCFIFNQADSRCQTLTLPVVGSVMFSKEYDKHTCPFLLESDVSKWSGPELNDCRQLLAQHPSQNKTTIKVDFNAG